MEDGPVGFQKRGGPKAGGGGTENGSAKVRVAQNLDTWKGVALQRGHAAAGGNGQTSKREKAWREPGRGYFPCVPIGEKLTAWNTAREREFTEEAHKAKVVGGQKAEQTTSRHRRKGTTAKKRRENNGSC